MEPNLWVTYDVLHGDKHKPWQVNVWDTIMILYIFCLQVLFIFCGVVTGCYLCCCFCCCCNFCCGKCKPRPPEDAGDYANLHVSQPRPQISIPFSMDDWQLRQQTCQSTLSRMFCHHCWLKCALLELSCCLTKHCTGLVVTLHVYTKLLPHRQHLYPLQPGDLQTWYTLEWQVEHFLTFVYASLMEY